MNIRCLQQLENTGALASGIFVRTQIRNNKLGEWAERLFLCGVWWQRQDWMSRETSHSCSEEKYSFLQNFLAEGLLTSLEEACLFHLFLFSGKFKEWKLCLSFQWQGACSPWVFIPFVSVCEERRLLVLLLLSLPHVFHLSSSFFLLCLHPSV